MSQRIHTSKSFLVFLWSIGLLVSLVLSGCATLTPAQRAATAQWQALADQVTTAMHTDRATVMLTTGSRGYVDRSMGLIVLGDRGNTRWLLAHELGHWVLGHRTVSLERALMQEKEANAQAIQILQLWGDSEDAAVRETVRLLVGLAGLHVRGHDFCAEAADVMRRYPAVGDPRDPGDTRCEVEMVQR